MARRSLIARVLGALCMLALLVGVALSRPASTPQTVAGAPPDATSAATFSSTAATSVASTLGSEAASTAVTSSSSPTDTIAAATDTTVVTSGSATNAGGATTASSAATTSSAAASPTIASAAPASTQIGSAYGPLPTGPCHLRQVAFCDTFAEGPYRGSVPNRNGALDPARWSVARVTENENSGQGQLFTFFPTLAMFCQTPITGVLPDADSFMCNGTDGKTTVLRGTEDMHWMSAINDGGSYAALGARILQPFDFAGRTGTIAFAVDLATRGPHSWWPSLMVSEQPVPLPHGDKPGVNSHPLNGFDIDFDGGCGKPAVTDPGGSALSDFPATTVGHVSVFKNYQEQDLNLPYRGDAACVLASRDQHNHIIVEVSQTSLDVYANDYTDSKHQGLRLILHLDQSDGFNLNFTRGYISLEHSQYAGAKFNGESAHTFHWHTVGFDGPILPTERAYQVPDSLTPVKQGDGQSAGDSIGYLTAKDSKPFTLANVDPRGAAAAFVTFDWREDAKGDPGLQVRLNGGAWRAVDTETGAGSFAAANAIAPLPISDVRPGANTLEISSSVGVTVANIDLLLDPAGIDLPAPVVNRAEAITAAAATTSTGSTAAPPHAHAAAAAPSPSPTPLRKRVLADCVSTDGGKTWSCTPAP